MSDEKKKKKPHDLVPVPEGMPNPESVIEVKAFVSPTGKKYKILKTTETDATDKKRKPPA